MVETRSKRSSTWRPVNYGHLSGPARTNLLSSCRGSGPTADKQDVANVAVRHKRTRGSVCSLADIHGRGRVTSSRLVISVRGLHCAPKKPRSPVGSSAASLFIFRSQTSVELSNQLAEATRHILFGLPFAFESAPDLLQGFIPEDPLLSFFLFGWQCGVTTNRVPSGQLEVCLTNLSSDS
jgi:hypothetical protein